MYCLGGIGMRYAIYECLLEDMYEGITDTFCTMNEREAIKWIEKQVDDYSAIRVWKDGKVVNCINYEYDFENKVWAKICG